MDKDTHVYCTLCAFGKDLIDGLMEDSKEVIPKHCETCNPWNPEDSCKFEERPNYVAIKNK